MSNDTDINNPLQTEPIGKLIFKYSIPAIIMNCPRLCRQHNLGQFTKWVRVFLT